MKDDSSIWLIDKNKLDEEWINHPKETFDFIKEYEKVKIDLEECNSELDVIAAQLSRMIRKNPKKYGLAAVPTETAINKTVIIRPKYREALKVVRDIQYKLGLLKAAVKTCDHKKSALERLVSLHGQSYFATPRAVDDRSLGTVDDIKTIGKKKRRQRTAKRRATRRKEEDE